MIKYKKRFLAYITIIAIIISFATFILLRLSSDKNKENSFVATVNGDPISVREFKNTLANKRADIFTYFCGKYHAEDSNDFWTKNFGDEIPIVLAKERALAECISVRILYALAQKEALIQDTSYSAFLKALKKENKRRKEAVAKNQVVYGPVEYSEANYFAYILSNMKSNLITWLKDTELKNVDQMDLNSEFEKLLGELEKQAEIKINRPVYSWVDIN